MVRSGVKNVDKSRRACQCEQPDSTRGALPLRVLLHGENAKLFP